MPAAVFFMLSTSPNKGRKTAQRYIDATFPLKRPHKGTQPPNMRLLVCYLHGGVDVIIGSSSRGRPGRSFRLFLYPGIPAFNVLTNWGGDVLFVELLHHIVQFIVKGGVIFAHVLAMAQSFSASY